jgi:osmotically-inducible protein OsmY
MGLLPYMIMKKLICLCFITTILSSCAWFKSSAAINQEYTTNSIAVTNMDPDEQLLSLKLANNLNHTYPGNHIVATAYQNKVLLTGQVLRLEDLVGATKLSKSYPGVATVINKMQVMPLETTDQLKQDLTTTQLAYAKLTRLISSSKLPKINLITTNGIIYVLSDKLSQTQVSLLNQNLYSILGITKIVIVFEQTNQNKN